MITLARQNCLTWESNISEANKDAVHRCKICRLRLILTIKATTNILLTLLLTANGN